MGPRMTIACVSAGVLLVLHPASSAQQNPFRLKEPDQRKACLACHTDFDQKLKKRVVHTPVRAGNCSECHDPHVSSHGKLLATEPREVCASCHDRVIPANAKSAHKVVAEGQCTKCHDPHASDNASVLLSGGADLCFGCHKELGAAIGAARFKHGPVGQNCLTCHAPHASDQAASLLKEAAPALCVRCHKADAPAFLARHMNYPVGRSACTSCHDPHGSNQPALLLNSVHAPVANRTCNVCHDAPGSAAPFATKQPGYQLCRGCHSEMVDATLAKGRLHWPVADRRSCVNCHNPHAAKHDKLLEANGAALCRGCHADTIARIAAVPVKHEPVASGSCIACHSPHSSTGVHLIDQPSTLKLCGTCHDYAQHSAHPIGDEAVDPRNKNLRVECLSCHKGHGTEFKWMLRTGTTKELCTQCHSKFAR